LPDSAGWRQRALDSETVTGVKKNGVLRPPVVPFAAKQMLVSSLPAWLFLMD
jgi:hypothetical protein